ncbi:MAG: hypothetical protein AAB796_00525 [Patescibacteria group bacterium]
MIIGHQTVLRFLNKAYSKDSVPHGLFFFGPRSVGKHAVATAFAESFLCDEKKFLGCAVSDGEFCESCNPENPYRKEHIILIDDIKDPEQKSIGIDDIFTLQQKISTSSFSGKPRFVIINDSERMTSEASNTLLKTLEEPPVNVYFILIAEAKDSLLPTIVSRTVPIRFSLTPIQELLEYLESHSTLSAEERSSCARFAHGRPGRMLSGLLNKEEMKEARKKYSTAMNLLASPLYSAFQKVDDAVKSEENLNEYPEYLFFVLRSLLLLGSRADDPNALKIPEAMQKPLLEKFKNGKLTDILKKLFFTDYLMKQTNVNKRIAFEAFLLELS